MTTIVPTSEEDPYLAIVRFTSQLAWADAGPEVGTNLCSQSSTSEYDCLFRKLLHFVIGIYEQFLGIFVFMRP